MSDKYKITDKTKAYFITLTIVDWIAIFIRKNQKFAIVNSLDYCCKNKGLTIFGYVLMPNHLHMICRADGALTLVEILRDFKGFTSKQIIHLIQEEPESRSEWILERFAKACVHLKRSQNYKVWQSGNQAKEIFSVKFFYEKLEYIHHNPVKDLIVSNPEDYIFSSARNYSESDNYLEIELADHKPLWLNKYY